MYEFIRSVDAAPTIWVPYPQTKVEVMEHVLAYSVIVIRTMSCVFIRMCDGAEEGIMDDRRHQ